MLLVKYDHHTNHNPLLIYSESPGHKPDKDPVGPAIVDNPNATVDIRAPVLAVALVIDAVVDPLGPMAVITS